MDSHLNVLGMQEVCQLVFRVTALALYYQKDKQIYYIFCGVFEEVEMQMHTAGLNKTN